MWSDGCLSSHRLCTPLARNPNLPDDAPYEAWLSMRRTSWTPGAPAESLSKDKLRLADQLTAQNIFESQRPRRRLTRSAISSSSIAAATASASMSESVPVRRASSVARRSLRAWSRRESIVSRSRVANLVTASPPRRRQKYFFNGTSSQFAGICHPSRFQIDQQPSQVEP